MQLNRFYPVIGTDMIAQSQEFYVAHFGFAVTFASDWYVSLKLTRQTLYEMALVDYTHPSVPTAFQRPVQGLILNFEVEDVDSEYDRLIHKVGLPLHKELQDEVFGQRHFITADPSGVLIDLIEIIPPSPEFAAQYTENLWDR
ncbi:MAG: VOC family protein [Cytophagales bacterium]|nr:VOC family protein [Armatimonadota bacterium]